MWFAYFNKIWRIPWSPCRGGVVFPRAIEKVHPPETPTRRSEGITRPQAALRFLSAGPADLDDRITRACSSSSTPPALPPLREGRSRSCTTTTNTLEISGLAAFAALLGKPPVFL